MNRKCPSLLSLLVVLLQIVRTCQVYQNQFAVHVPRGVTIADDIARRNGLINNGQIGDLENHFLFISPRLKKRSISRCLVHESLLKNETDIIWFQQQKHLRRVKRDVPAVQADVPAVQQNFPEITDPLYKDQWYLNHGAKDGADMNIQGAWELGYTGKGVVVTILDDGIQHNHPDLEANYDKLASKDINDDDEDPMPQDNGDNKHGTRCAGEVAAVAFNDYCGVGIAYNASIGGVRMLDGIVNDAVEAKGLSLNPSHIDIYSASWGPEDDGRTVDGPGPLALKAFINGVNNGRDGKGSIFVWASGNGGRHTDNCNCDGYTNSVHTLSISSATQGGLKPWYLEECSSTLATTYSSGTPGQDASITTVDQNARLIKSKLCTSGHTGTSASAPLAAGVLALALEANSELTWRDMQHLVIYTSNPNPLDHETGWEVNSVGRNFSHKFGYGLLDGTALVKLAINWKRVPDQHICKTRVEDIQKVLPKTKGMKVSVSMITDGCDNTINKVGYLEHVQCILSLKYPPRGNLKISIRSPRGTKSFLLLPRPQDRISSGFEDWPFLSVHFWGEDPTGEWFLDIEHDGKSNAKVDGILKHWQLVLHGTSEDPFPDKKIQNIHPSKSNEGLSSGETSKNSGYLPDKADIKLSDTSTPNINCLTERPDGGCEKECSSNEYLALLHTNNKGSMDGERKCIKCDISCESCFGPNFNQCLTCTEHLFLVQDLAECVKECPKGYTKDSKKGACKKCEKGCSECQLSESEGGPLICTKCESDLYLAGNVCRQICPHGQYPTNSTCSPCYDSCLTCTGGLDTQCGQCKPGTFYFQRRCVSYCPPGYFSQEGLNECMSCPHGCDECYGPDGACVKCKQDWIKSQTGECLPPESAECQPGMYSGLGTCLACHSTCKTCVGPKDQDCSSCYPDHRLLISTCVETCPDRYHPSESIRSCLPCPHTCKACTNGKCTHCLPGYVLVEEKGSCEVSCPLGYFSNEDSECKPCHASCSECYGPASNHCISCQKDLMFAGGDCSVKCPRGFYQEASNCHRCHSGCTECSGSGPMNCTVCALDKVLEEGYCTGCEAGYYLILTEHAPQCVQCHSTCGTCSGPARSQCTACTGELQLDTWSNTCVPCCTTFQESGTSCCLCGSLGLCTSPARITRSLIASSTVKGFFFGLFGVIGLTLIVIYFTSRSKLKTGIRKISRLIRQGEEYCKIPVNPTDIQDQKPFISDSRDCSSDEDEDYQIIDS